MSMNEINGVAVEVVKPETSEATKLNVVTEGKLASNVISKKAYRKIQQKVLNQTAEYLLQSYGPNGSTSKILIEEKDTHPIYTKDGHRIIKNIKYLDSIENSIIKELEDFTFYVAKEVGDGTTTACEIIANVFNKLVEYEKSGKYRPHKLISDFQKVAEILKEKILEQGHPITLDAIYKIALTATNSNETIANDIKKIYEQQGFGVHIDVGMSFTDSTVIKIYDGMTLNVGYLDSWLINTNDGKVKIRNPRIYAFKDNIMTPELISYFDRIIYHNIIEPAMTGKEMIPTVILTPSISRDLSNTINQLISIMSAYASKGNVKNKPPILIVSDLYADTEYEDIARLCGCRLIINYINPDVQAKDIEAGNAPDINTIVDWYGGADLVEASADETKIVNPYKMFEYVDGERIIAEDGSMTHSALYEGILSDVQQELDNLVKENAKLKDINDTRRRLNNLSANLVDYLIGGVSSIDREATKDLAEDAIVSCESAVKTGYGYGANIEILKAIKSTEFAPELQYIVDILDSAYTSLLLTLYCTVYHEDSAKALIKSSLAIQEPINLNTGKFDQSVLTSIDADRVIIDCISKILTIMFTSNQAIIQNPAYNVYASYEED